MKDLSNDESTASESPMGRCDEGCDDECSGSCCCCSGNCYFSVEQAAWEDYEDRPSSLSAVTNP